MTDHPVPPSTRLEAAFAHLPQEKLRPQVSGKETGLVVVTIIHLCFLPWALGGMHLWSQAISLVLSLAGFSLLLTRWPASETQPSSLRPVTTLFSFPAFWAGAGVLIYVAVQGLNPSWRYFHSEDAWWLEPLNAITWLPSGVDAPFDRSNPWRAMLVYTSLWLLICSVWAGFCHRRSYRTLFIALAVNAAVLALLGVLQQLTDTRKIFWSYSPSNLSFVSSFIYRNHAGAYFNLMVAMSLALSWWFYRRSQRLHDQSSPAMIFSFLAVFIGLMVVFSSSRSSILLLLGFMAIVGGMMAFRVCLPNKTGRHRSEHLVLVMALVGFVVVGVASLRVERVWQRFAGMMADPVASTRDRNLARTAAFEMFSDRWVLGWGAGCFRHGFPLYAQAYPEIYFSDNKTHKYWEHAHNDLLEFPIELGVLGVLPVIAVLGHLAWRLTRHPFWKSVLALPITLACGLVLVHAGVDFVFQNPAVLLTWSTLLIGIVRYLEFDQPAAPPRRTN